MPAVTVLIQVPPVFSFSPRFPGLELSSLLLGSKQGIPKS